VGEVNRVCKPKGGESEAEGQSLQLWFSLCQISFAVVLG
jgi:hypothetical protein